MKKVVLATTIRNLDQIVNALGDDVVLLNERDFAMKSIVLNLNWLEDMESELVNIAVYDKNPKYSNAKYVFIPFNSNNSAKHMLNSLMNHETGFIFAMDTNFVEGSLSEDDLMSAYNEICTSMNQAYLYKMPIMTINNLKEFAEFLKDDKVFEALLEKVKGVEAYRFGSVFSDTDIKPIETTKSNT